MKALLLNAYDTDSHRTWCRGLMRHFPEIEWRYLSLPGRHFSWRIRGNPLSWLFTEQRAVFAEHYDLIVATSMVDLATLKGLDRRLAATPSLVYFHENQFAYPANATQHKDITPKTVNLYAALSADWVVFNSEYNRRSFVEGVEQLMARLPDHTPRTLGATIMEKSQVLPVPIEPPEPAVRARRRANKHQPLKVLWNHRWEYDKGPEQLLRLVEHALARQANIEFTIAGRAFRQVPKAFRVLAKQDNVVHMGRLEEKAYQEALRTHDVVLSTALHEFQGLAMLRGASHGCTPLAPNDLAYPEWVPPESLYHNTDDAVARLLAWSQQECLPTASVDAYYWPNLHEAYRQLLYRFQDTLATPRAVY